MSPLIYPANRIWSDGRPRHIRCYEMCSIDSGLWCWDATTQAASDDAPSKRRGWRGVLSFSFEVRVRQGRVTLPCKSLQGVRAPNTRIQSPVELAPLRGTPRMHSQTSSNLRIVALAGALDNQNNSQENLTSSDFSQASATRLLTFLESNLPTPDRSRRLRSG